MDPGTITKLTLMGVSVFAKTVDTCIAAYKAYKISASFGEDWVAADRRFTIQLAKLKTLSQTPISWFENDFRNEQDELTIAVKMQLVDIEGHFIKCRNIIKKYHKQGVNNCLPNQCILNSRLTTINIEKALGYQEDKAQELLEEQGQKNSQQPLPKPGKKSAPLRKLAF
ncbi:hypothetical protein NPX13_g8400 [Xylaria arbuscula]|uniref:Prion-inhibition and propagation HeLo domain-containing protein n=1 Tax=Xylaria arbuscula TaxID=114810 RepID=A0A9W8N8T5_9PEZI|nr:hypothetical protein NPX13_g8400 [Xylaria arbuscula]